MGIFIKVSSYELKASARKLISENAPKLFFVSILFIVIVTLISEFQYRLMGTASALEQLLEHIYDEGVQSINQSAMTFLSFFRPSGAALAIVLRLMLPVLDAGYASYCMKINRGQGGEYKDILDGFLVFIKVILISIITTIFVLLWSLLFIVPGIIAGYRYRQAIYILLDDPKKGVFQCIRESKSLMRGKKLDLFLVDLTFIGWVMIDFLVVWLLPLPFSFPVISIWLTPYMGLTRAGFYDKLINTLVV